MLASYFQDLRDRVLAAADRGMPTKRIAETFTLNLASHNHARTRELIEGVNAELLFLPSYSPDFSSIEMVSSKIGQMLWSLACRTTGSLWRSMHDQMTPADAANCCRHCGYTLREN